MSSDYYKTPFRIQSVSTPPPGHSQSPSSYVCVFSQFLKQWIIHQRYHQQTSDYHFMNQLTYFDKQTAITWTPLYAETIQIRKSSLCPCLNGKKEPAWIHLHYAPLYEAFSQPLSYARFATCAYQMLKTVQFFALLGCEGVFIDPSEVWLNSQGVFVWCYFYAKQFRFSIHPLSLTELCEQMYAYTRFIQHIASLIDWRCENTFQQHIKSFLACCTLSKEEVLEFVKENKEQTFDYMLNHPVFDHLRHSHLPSTLISNKCDRYTHTLPEEKKALFTTSSFSSSSSSLSAIQSIYLSPFTKKSLFPLSPNHLSQVVTPILQEEEHVFSCFSNLLTCASFLSGYLTYQLFLRDYPIQFKSHKTILFLSCLVCSSSLLDETSSRSLSIGSFLSDVQFQIVEMLQYWINHCLSSSWMESFFLPSLDKLSFSVLAKEPFHLRFIEQNQTIFSSIQDLFPSSSSHTRFEHYFEHA